MDKLWIIVILFIISLALMLSSVLVKDIPWETRAILLALGGLVLGLNGFYITYKSE